VVRPVTSLGHQGWRKGFWEGLKFFKLGLILKHFCRHREHSLQIEIWNTVITLISGDFIKFSECQVPMNKCKAPIVKTFWRRFWFKSHMLSRDRFVATCVRFLAVWKSHKRANREPTSCNRLGAFYLTCFARGSEIFGKRVATWSKRCALTSLCLLCVIEHR